MAQMLTVSYPNCCYDVMSGNRAKKFRKAVKKVYKEVALDYLRRLIKDKNFFGRLQIGWRIFRCKI